MTKKKSGFWTFIFSLLPGAGEMYMGFMKMGLSLMGLFFALVVLANFWESGICLMMNVVVWFYSFFHAHNLRAMDDEDFYALEDHFLFGTDASFKDFWDKTVVSRYRKIVASVLILLGVMIVWGNVFDLLEEALPEAVYECISELSYHIPKIVIGIGIIAVGILLIRGKRQELLEDGIKEGKGNGREEDDQNS